MKVLVIEDDQDSADILARLLRLHGKEVEVAYDGLAGLRYALASSPDVIVSDITMPGLDGYQVASKVREAAIGAPMMIALSAYIDDPSKPKAAGFDHFMTKPADFARLNALIDSSAVDRRSE